MVMLRIVPYIYREIVAFDFDNWATVSLFWVCILTLIMFGLDVFSVLK